MPRTDDPYSRVYWNAVDDPKFATVWSDDHALAWWLRLLLAADQSWPASAALPFGVHRAGLKKLTDAKLVDVTGIRYRIHGLDAERERRSQQGKAGAAARWTEAPPPPLHDSERTPPAPLNGMHKEPGRNANGVPKEPDRNASQDEPSQDKKRQEETRDARPPAVPVGHPESDLMALFTELTGLAFVPMATRNGDRLVRWVAKDGWPKVEAAARRAAADLGGYPEPGQLVNTIDNYLHPPLTGAPLSLIDRRAAEAAAVHDELTKAAAARRAAKEASK